MANKSKAGRPSTHTYDELTTALNKYILKHKNQKITLSGLARETGISRNIWKHNEEIRDLIHRVNNPPLITRSNSKRFDFTIVKAEQLVNKYYKNKPKLIRSIQDVFDTISTMYDYANIGFETKEREKVFEEKIKELQAQLKEKQDELDKIQSEIDWLYVDSASPLQRSRKGIRDNLIDLDSKRVEALSTSLEDIEEDYDGLFD